MIVKAIAGSATAQRLKKVSSDVPGQLVVHADANDVVVEVTR